MRRFQVFSALVGNADLTVDHARPPEPQTQERV
jgi:hypothetical protein